MSLLAAAVLAGAAGATGAAAKPAPSPPVWRTLEPGLDLGEFTSPRPSSRGDSIVRVLRADPKRFALRLLNASAPGEGRARTAREWSERADLVAAINASMYQADHRTSVSLMRTAGHVNNPGLSKDRALLAFDPLEGAASPFLIIDRDCDDLDALRPKYGTLVQSIRMVSCRRTNVWSQQPRRFSTAAIGRDTRGRVLFVHARSPWSTHDLIDVLLALPIDLQRALYVEGGPEAQLFVHAGGEEREWVGRFEADVEEQDDNHRAWPIPNVVGLQRRTKQ